MKTAFKPRFRSQYRETAAREKHREKQNGSGAVQYRETNIIAFGLTTRNVSVSFVFFFLFRSPSLATRECIRGRIHGPSVFKSVIDARIHAIAVRSWQPDNYSCLTRHHDQSIFSTPRARACVQICTFNHDRFLY